MSSDLVILPAKAPPLTRDQALKRKRELAVQRRAARRAAGICAKCGKQPPRPDKALCAACTQIESDRWHRKKKGRKSRGESAAKRASRLDRQRDYMAERNAKLKADGICTSCATAPAVADRTKCAACAATDATHRERNKPAKPKPKPKPKRRRETVPCALCRGAVDVHRAVAQPTGPLWPQCVSCVRRVAAHVQGIKSARAARQDGEREA